jgi:hypothetical protein
LSSVADDATLEAPAPPIPLDGLAYGVDHLDALLVFHLGDAHLHAAWVRADAGFRADEAVSGLRDAYRVCQFASRRLSTSTAGERRGEAQNPLLTLEVASRTALLRRVRAHVVAVVFDAAMPLGMARLVAARLAATLEPELPREGAASPDAPLSTSAAAPRSEGNRAPRPTIMGAPPPPDAEDREPQTMAYGPRSSPRGMPRVTLSELDRTRRLLMYAEANAPEPHTVRLRIALRTGLTPLALEHAEALSADAAVLIETAVEEILGVDRAELRSVV